jgi:hypothetical protein
MARALARVEDDAEVRRSLSTRGTERARDASFARAAGRLVAVLREAAVA